MEDEIERQVIAVSLGTSVRVSGISLKLSSKHSSPVTVHSVPYVANAQS